MQQTIRITLLVAITFVTSTHASTYNACKLANGLALFPGYEPNPVNEETISIVSDNILTESQRSDNLAIYQTNQHKLSAPIAGFASSDDWIAEVVICDPKDRLIDLIWVNIRTKKTLRLLPNMKNTAVW